MILKTLTLKFKIWHKYLEHDPECLNLILKLINLVLISEIYVYVMSYNPGNLKL